VVDTRSTSCPRHFCNSVWNLHDRQGAPSPRSHSCGCIISHVFSACEGFPPVPRRRGAKLLGGGTKPRATLSASVFLEAYRPAPRDARIESGTVYFPRRAVCAGNTKPLKKKLFNADGLKTVWFYVPADNTVTKAPIKNPKLGLGTHKLC